MIRIRVRGIYTTALSKIFLDEGFILTDLSDVMKQKLSRPLAEGPADVIVKSLDEDQDSVLIVASNSATGRKVEEVLAERLSHLAIRRGRLGLYSTVIAIGAVSCRALLPGGIAAIVQGACQEEGKPFYAYVTREALDPGEDIIVRPGAAAVGTYVTVMKPGEGVTFSEHIRDEQQKQRIAEALGDLPRTSHIRLRSNARLASPPQVAAEARELTERLSALLSSPPHGEPRIVREGEYISIVTLPLPAKLRLDEERSAIRPTIKLHHSLRAGGPEESALVDFAEEALRLGHATPNIGLAALSYILSTLRDRRLTIYHATPDGRKIRLEPFELEGYDLERGRLKLRRIFRSPGLLDGLGVEKRPGDYSITTVELSSWHIVHEYYSREGKLLGIYANINTPPEVSMKGIRYLDLYVDVVKRPGEEPRIIDLDQLEDAAEKGYITEALRESAMEEAEKARKMLSSLP